LLGGTPLNHSHTETLLRKAQRLLQWAPVRTLGERHRERVAEHLLALNEADRMLRFGHLASDERIHHYAEQLDFERDEVLGVFNRRLKLVAMAHLAFGPARDTAEFGVSVNARVRGRGLGAQLFEHAVTHARNRGAHTMLIHLARDNAAMLGIVRRAGAALRFEGTDALAELPLPANTLGSQIQELMGHQAGEFDYRLKLQVLRLDAMRPRPG
jgi:ribosomal protein S18 acetylase RimI-like enzyme